MRSEWIMSEGGPLIVLDDVLRKNWGGIFRLTIQDADACNDYVRACRVTSYLEIVPVVGGMSLIIGDIPMDSCFWQLQPDYFSIVQVCYCNTDFDVDKAMSKFVKQCVVPEPEQTVNFRFEGGDLVMFDSSDGGDREPKSVSSALCAGSYAISTYTYEPDDETSLVIHAFRCQPQALRR